MLFFVRQQWTPEIKRFPLITHVCLTDTLSDVIDRIQPRVVDAIMLQDCSAGLWKMGTFIVLDATKMNEEAKGDDLEFGSAGVTAAEPQPSKFWRELVGILCQSLVVRLHLSADCGSIPGTWIRVARWCSIGISGKLDFCLF